jgi:hypothetical protein
VFFLCQEKLSQGGNKMLKPQELGLEFKFEHRNADGELLYDSGWLGNHMTDDGMGV